jgi:cytochrome oxidase assembly protein ShyY1
MVWRCWKRFGRRDAVQVEPPENSGYMIAAYVIAAVILIGYWVALWRKAKKSVSGKKKG